MIFRFITASEFTRAVKALDELGLVYGAQVGQFITEGEEAVGISYEYLVDDRGQSGFSAMVHVARWGGKGIHHNLFSILFEPESDFGRLFQLDPDDVRTFFGEKVRAVPQTSGCNGCCFDTDEDDSCGCTLMDRSSLGTVFTRCSNPPVIYIKLEG
jgi:hypothetical protein